MLLLHKAILGAKESIDPDFGGSGKRAVLLSAILLAGEGSPHAQWRRILPVTIQ